MISVNEYELYKTISDLPVKTEVFLPLKGTSVKAVVQILHGMCEHKERYYEFIKYLNSHGYICVISDMRGHGENVSFFKELGYFGDDGHKLLINDVHAVTVFIKNNYPDVPIFLMGHSMGTLIARAVLKFYDDDYDKVILLGSPSNRFGKMFGLFLASLEELIRGEKKTSRLLDAVVMGPYVLRFREEKSQNAWLCTDASVVEKFNEDMYCNFTFTVNGYYTLLKIMQIAYSTKNWRLKNKRLPILFLSGKDDSCAISEDKFSKAVEHLKTLGYRHVEGRMYDGMRHEILNEKDKEKVFEDIIEWLNDDEELIQV